MKRVFTVLICLIATILLLLALEQRFFPPSFKGEVVQTWETTNTPFRIRVNMHIERGGFAPVLGGAYYDFQSAADGSDSWHEIMTFRHDGPIDIPKDPVRFANDQVQQFLWAGCMQSQPTAVLIGVSQKYQIYFRTAKDASTIASQICGLMQMA